ncbi:unnamed protein product, partial [marine sediment metagenome]
MFQCDVPNAWDDGTEGNYWGDYKGADNNNDGIGDTSYYIPGMPSGGGNNKDRFPLMFPWDEIPLAITDVDVIPFVQKPGEPVNITCTVVCSILVDTVTASITTPSSTNEFVMSNIPGTDDYYYNTTYAEEGTYDYFIWANDTSENEVTSDVYQFIISEKDIEPPVISDVAMLTSDPLDTDPLFGWENVTCIVTDNVAVATVKLVMASDTATVEYVMVNIPETDTYYCNTTFIQCGVYNYSIWADDVSLNNATSLLVVFELPPNWDVNVDGRGHLQDFVLVAKHYN